MNLAKARRQLGRNLPLAQIVGESPNDVDGIFGDQGIVCDYVQTFRQRLCD